MNNVSYLQLRETKFAPVQLDKVQLDGTFSGYASLFDEVDMGNDVVVSGAFKKSLQERKPSDIRMLFQHNPDQPIGTWQDIQEDQRGLKVAGRITSATAKGTEILELMRAGAIDGLSIGFKTIRSRKDPITKVRKIITADLWEISVVTFPMQAGARIDSVKSQLSSLRPTIRDFEKWLTRDAGLTRRDARNLLQKGYAHMASTQDAASQLNQNLADYIRQATKSISARSR